MHLVPDIPVMPDKLICIECSDPIGDLAHNYGMPEYPLCIRCYAIPKD